MAHELASNKSDTNAHGLVRRDLEGSGEGCARRRVCRDAE
jgi:hypothetical protein